MTTLNGSWFTEVFQNEGMAFSLKIRQKLHEEHSEFQKLEIYETETFGNLMVLDGRVSLTARDNFLYHEMMTHPALFTHKEPKTVVIIGGGDCGTLREVLKHPEVEDVWQVEIDQEVTKLSEKYFAELCESNGDPRANLVFGDGVQWIQHLEPNRLDVIIIDSSDPLGAAEGLLAEDFYRNCMLALREGGILVQQSESPLLHADTIIRDIHNNMEKAGLSHVITLPFPQPVSPSGWWSCTMASKDNPLHQFREADAAERPFVTGYYNEAIHHAALAQPQFMRDPRWARRRKMVLPPARPCANFRSQGNAMAVEMPSHFPQRVVAYLVDHCQIPLPEIINAVGLPPEAMLRGNAFLSGEIYLALVRFAIERTGDPAVGLGYGLNLQLSDLGMPGYAFGAQATVAAGIELFASHYDGMSRMSRLAVDKGNGYFLRILLEPGLPQFMTWFLSEAIVAAALQNMARFRVPLGCGINAHFAYPRPPHHRCYDELRVPCYFGEQATGVYVPEKVLSLPLSGADSLAPWPAALGLSVRCPGKTGTGGERLEDQLVSIVCASLPVVPTLLEVAQRFGSSPRKLQRQLEQKGMGFRQLVSEIRVREAAERLLRNDYSIREVAEQTGFSDPASFSRAFRRVFEMTPGQYRQQQAVGGHRP